MPAEITVTDIAKWQKEVLQRIKPVTWNNYIRHLKALYNFGVEQELLNKPNPFNSFFIREGKKPKKTFTDEQLKAIQNLLESQNLKEPQWFIETLISTFALTAIRRGQLLKLTIENIDLNRNIITIPAEINKTYNEHKLPINELLIPKLTNLINQHKLRKSSQSAQLFNINLFSNKHKKRQMDDSQLSAIFKQMSKQLKFKVSPHRFRHTIATNLMTEPKNLYLVKEILGHSTLAVTLSYIEQNPENLRSTINKIKWI